ncbi:MAG: TolB family protein, partial [Methylocella sp.]
MGAGNTKLLLFDREGKHERSIDDVGHALLDVRLSPDGHRAAVFEAGGTQGFNTWILGLDNNTRMRLTFGLTTEGMAWSADGRALFYAAFDAKPAANTKGTYRIVRKATDGTGQEETILESADRMN